jgi:transcriptional regulator with XRE-family HTH domain
MENYKDWLIKFGNRVRIERERQKLTRITLAAKVNTEQGYIVQIEKGVRSPSLKTFTSLLTALGVSADYLIFGTLEDEINEKENIYKDFFKLIKAR